MGRLSSLSDQIVGFFGRFCTSRGATTTANRSRFWSGNGPLFEGAFAPDAEVAALSIARGNGKSCLLAGVAASGLAPGGAASQGGVSVP